LSAMSLRSALLAEEIGKTGEKLLPLFGHWQKLFL
jgi:hypothetical protein